MDPLIVHPVTWERIKPYVRKYGMIYSEHRHDWKYKGTKYVCRKCGDMYPVGGGLPQMGCTVREEEFQWRTSDD